MRTNYTNFRTNPNFRAYLLCFVGVLLFTFGWGIIFYQNFKFLWCGLLVSQLMFDRVIKIHYPKSLKFNKSSKENFFLKIKKEKIVLLSSIAILFVYLFYPYIFINFILTIGEKLAFIVVEHSYIYILVCLIFIVLLIIVIFYKGPKMFTRFKTNFIKLHYNRNHRKMFLFFRLYPNAKKDMFISLLSAFTFFINTPILFYPFLFASCRYHGGVEVYFLFFICIILALIVTLPSFRKTFFERYPHKSSARIVGWNGPEISGAKVAFAGFLAGVSVITTGLVADTLDSEAKRIICQRHDAFETRREDVHNMKVDVRRERDPQGFEKGYYQYAPLKYTPIERPKPAARSSGFSWSPETGFSLSSSISSEGKKES